jgi:hypothetical protein
MFDLIKEIWKVEKKLQKEDGLFPPQKEEEIKEKTKEEVLAEKIIEKCNLCKSNKLLKKAFKISNDPYWAYGYGSYVYFNSNFICEKGGPVYTLKVEYEYAETFYKYLCKAVDTINAHVEKKEIRRKTKELECMKKFIGVVK